MQNTYSRIGVVVSLAFHSLLFGAVWLLLQLPKPVISEEEIGSISIEMFAARLEQPQIASAPEPETKEEELEPEPEPEPEPEVIPEPIAPKPEAPKEQPKPKEKEKPKPKPKEKEKPKEKPKTAEKPKPVKALEKSAEVKQGIVAKAIPDVLQGTKMQAGSSNGAEKGGQAQGNGNAGSGGSSDEINAYRAKLKRLLQQKANNAYPQRERMMRKTGVVELTFTLTSSGQIQNVRVIKSSGNENLDMAAVKATQSTQPPPPPAGFPGNVAVPVSFTIM